MPVQGLPKVLETMLQNAVSDLTLLSWNINGKDNITHINIRFCMEGCSTGSETETKFMDNQSVKYKRVSKSQQVRDKQRAESHEGKDIVEVRDKGLDIKSSNSTNQSVADDTLAQSQPPEVQYQATLTSQQHVTQYPAAVSNPQAGNTESVTTGQPNTGQGVKADQCQQTTTVGQYTYPVISSNYNCSSCRMKFQPQSYVFKCITPPCTSLQFFYIMCRNCHDNGTHKEHSHKEIMYVQ